MRYSSMLDALCIAPTIRISSMFPNHQVWCKGDVLYENTLLTERSDRIAVYLLNKSLEKDEAAGKSILVIPIDSVTKISLAKIGIVKGFQVVVVAPESISLTYVKKIIDGGADIVYSPSHLGINGAIAKAEKIVHENTDALMLSYNRKTILAEVLAHEIARDFPDGLDYVVIPSKSKERTNYLSFFIKKAFPNVKIFMTHTQNHLSFIDESLHRTHHAPRPKNFEFVDGIIIASDSRASHIASVLRQKEGLPMQYTIALTFNALEKLIKVHSVSKEKVLLGLQSEL